MSTSEQDVNYAKGKLEEAEKKAETEDEEKAFWMRQAEGWGKTVRELLQKPRASADWLEDANANINSLKHEVKKHIKETSGYEKQMWERVEHFININEGLIVMWL